MKLVVQVKLMPTPEQAAALGATLRACNQAACRVSEVAFENRCFRNFALRKHVYAGLKDSGLGAQAAQHVIKKTCDAYTALRGSIKAGQLGQAGSKRRAEAEGKPIVFRPDAAQPYDDRMLSWQHDAGTVSIWTITGRLKNVAFTGSPEQLKRLREYRRGESDLVQRDGMWFLYAVCDVPEKDSNREPSGWLGVDLGIVNIATTSDGALMAGRRLNRYRKRQQDLRTKLQAKGTQSARRVLKRQRRKETRFVTDTNHCISKSIVAEAARTGRGIALEELKGIRERVRLRKPQRAAVHSWSFDQLGQFILYKAALAGVLVLQVDPAYSSQECAECHHTEKRNRPTQAVFFCRGCGVVAHADRNASRNLSARAARVWDSGAQSTVPAASTTDTPPDTDVTPQPVAGTHRKPGRSRLGS